VAIADGGRARSAGHVATAVEDLELFAASLAADDRVVLEATGNALAIAKLIAPHMPWSARSAPNRFAMSRCLTSSRYRRHGVQSRVAGRPRLLRSGEIRYERHGS